MTPHTTAAAADSFDLHIRKPGRAWHIAARSKSWAVAVLTGENMRHAYGYEYDVRPAVAS